MLVNIGDDVQREREGAPSVFERDDGRGAAADSRLGTNAVRQRSGSSDVTGGFSMPICGIDRRRDVRRAAAYRERDHVLPAIVDGNVLARLEEAQLADAFRGNAAGSEVGDAAGGNSIRTFAMSVLPDRMGRPTARTSSTGDFTNDSTISRSWIMRSSTTSTSSERGVKTLMRWTSKNMGWVINGTGGADGGVEALRDARPARCGLFQRRSLRVHRPQ